MAAKAKESQIFSPLKKNSYVIFFLQADDIKLDVLNGWKEGNIASSLGKYYQIFQVGSTINVIFGFKSDFYYIICFTAISIRLLAFR